MRQVFVELATGDDRKLLSSANDWARLVFVLLPINHLLVIGT